MTRTSVSPRKHENSKDGSDQKRFVVSWFRSCLIAFAAGAAACAPAPQTAATPDGVRAAAGEIATAATALGAPAMKIDTAALQLAATTDLENARARFGALSEAIDAYMTGLHLVPPAGVKVAFCPMVQKPWLQADATIVNPYYGKDMLTCGSFR
jgi:hypothetical protein